MRQLFTYAWLLFLAMPLIGHGQQIPVPYPDSMAFRPFTIYKEGGVYKASATVSTVRNALVPGRTPWYINYINGNDSNSGLSISSPKKTATAAYAAGARLIYAAAGIYRQNTFTITQSLADTTSLVIIGAGKDETFFTGGNSAAETWTTIGSGAYSSPVTQAFNVLDAKYKDTLGLMTQLKYVSTVDSVKLIPGSCFFNTTTTYVHTQDSRLPDNSVLVIKNGTGNTYSANNGNLYIEGISFVGTTRAIQVYGSPSSAASNVKGYFNSCNFLYSVKGEGLWCYNIASSWAENCLAAYNKSDGFNYKSVNNQVAMQVVEINNQSFLNGYYLGVAGASSIANASSAHSSIDVIRVNCVGWGNAGPNFIDITAVPSEAPFGKKQYILNAGVTAYNSNGRFSPAEGNSGSADFNEGSQAGNAGYRGLMYLYGCISKSDSAFKAKLSSTIYVDQDTKYRGTVAGNVVFFNWEPANLSNLAISAGMLSPKFDTEKTSYKVTESNGLTSVKITPTANNPSAVIKVNGKLVASGSASASIRLNVGSNTITVLVTAQTGITKTYVLTINKSPTLTFNTLANHVYGVADFNPVAKTTTGTVTLVTDNADIATITPGKLVHVKAAGVVHITATNGIDTVTQPLTITPALLTITAPSHFKRYGAIMPSIAPVYKGFVNGEDASTLVTQPTVATAAAASSPIGVYAVTVGGAVANADYTITYVLGTLTVTAAPLTITAANKTKKAGTVNPPLTLTIKGFVNGDTQNSLTTQPTVSTTATTGSPAGTYPITASGAADSNYTFTYVNGTLTVTSAPGFAASISPDDTARVTASHQLFVHQAVSPDGDGINDFLKIEGIEAYADNKLTIMNAGGATIFKMKGYDNNSRTFDGQSNINGRLQRAGTYFYVLEYKAGDEVRRKSGYFVLRY